MICVIILAAFTLKQVGVNALEIGEYFAKSGMKRL